MFRYVVSVMEDNVSVLQIRPNTVNGEIQPRIPTREMVAIHPSWDSQEYPSLSDVPQDIANKVKLLMWVREDDQSYFEGIGSRIGKNLYWIS